MKNAFLLIAGYLLSTNGMAQNVGIGTTTPKYKLHLHNSTTDFNYLNITTSATTDASLRGILLGLQFGTAYLWNYENTPFYFGNNGGIKMQIAPNGNVGIGSSTSVSPAFLLDVQDRMRLRAGTANDIFTTPGIWFDDYRFSGTANAERAFFGMQDSIRLGFYGGGTGGVAWGMNFNTKTGNVNVGNYDGPWRFNISGSDLGMTLYNASNTFYGSMSSNSGHLSIQANYGNVFSGTSGKHILLNPPSSFFQFVPGNVGINVTEPTARLQVNGSTLIGSGSPAAGYQLSVKGKVICEEAKVQLSGSWPDYVFAASYQKPTLYQVEEYIAQNHHLPNIPAAAEIEKDGLLLGDMQKRTIEKVEELTLYLIDLKKENDQLKERVKRLEKVNK